MGISQDSLEIKIWKLRHDMRHAVKTNNNYSKGIELFEAMHKMENSYSSGHWRLAAISYDKLGKTDKSIQVMKEMKSRGDSTFCYKDYASLREYSNELQSNLQFCKLCKRYDYAITFPCEYSEYRDSLVKYLILEGPLDKPQEVFVIMGYESYYDSLSGFKSMPLLERINYSHRKIDSLVRMHGYPTIDKVVDPWVEFLAGGSFIHSLSEDRYLHYIENYSSEMSPNDKAYIIDKIAVKKKIKQTYGTQLEEDKLNGGYRLYPVNNVENLNKRRMNMDLAPIETYLKQWGISYENILRKD